MGRGTATAATGTALGAVEAGFGARIIPMTLGAVVGTAMGGRAATGAGFAAGAEFNTGAGLATGTFLGIWAGTGAAARAGLEAAA